MAIATAPMVTVEAYQWKPGTRIRVSAAEAAAAFSRIREVHGHVTPALVVQEARKAKSVLHGEFEWDKSTAAQEAWESRASYLIRAFVIVYKHPDGHLAPAIRGLVPVQHARADEPETEIEARAVEPRTYVPILTAMTDEELRRRQVERAWLDLWAWRQRYKDYAEFAGILHEIDRKARERSA